MIRRLRFLLSLLFVMFLIPYGTGQILGDTASMNLIRKGVEDIYGFRFDASDKLIGELSNSFPGHPVNYLLTGLSEYWKGFPLTTNSPSSRQYENDLRKCIEICEDNRNVSLETEFLLGNLSGRGLLLLYYTDNDISNEVTPLAASTYKHLKRSLSLKRESADLMYFSGVYNYYRDAYPKIHPVYKPVALLFPPGNSETGIRELELCAKEGFVLGNEAYYMLYWIMMNYENNYIKSISYIKRLNDTFPENPLYRIMYIKNLLLLKRYDEAEKIIELQGTSYTNGYLRACNEIFEGILQEKSHSNFRQARESYLKGIHDLEPYGAYSNEFRAYGYFGLSRISNLPGEKEIKRKYHRLAMDLASFKRINFDD